MTGYASGPGATVAATASALAVADHARSIVLVEGISDQIALETLAKRHERDLAAEGVVVTPIGGARAISGFLRRFRAEDTGPRVLGLCDAAETAHFGKALARAGLADSRNQVDLERRGFFVCVEDLEDELIRAVGRSRIETVLAAEGDLGSFRTLLPATPPRTDPPEAVPRLHGSERG